MVSIIIPLYNKADYIHKCVTSVLCQTFSEFELIIVNDGSTDNSFAIVQQFADKRIRYIQQKNAGVSISRNNGVATAKYNYISFLDADDWWDTHFLEKMFMLIEDFPEAAIFGCQYFWIKNNVTTLSVNYEESGFRGYIDYFKAYTYKWWMPLTSISVIIKKQFFSKLGGFNPNLRFGEDFDLWIRFSLNYKVAYINEPLAYYNQDVDTSNRAIGGHKLYPPPDHFIFNLSYLRPFERKSIDLKKLLDGLRVRALMPYYSTGHYALEVKAILSIIDFTRQSLFFRLFYSAPVPFVRFYTWGMQVGSRLKRIIRQRIQV
ncbi:glycosyltransferase family 2 protein [Spirosoma fluviale]|uniref:Glycosyl transferase family 2 n=1 Tax=Spirosoma fluviale TaxID=1597977 RepID=A0A286FDG2_9BACT|nr:glycosyltransferase [Spirosoma fluviale]SOD81242.1 Glycosyl transferase family 2 [Spirosoma fluviale]